MSRRRSGKQPGVVRPKKIDGDKLKDTNLWKVLLIVLVAFAIYDQSLNGEWIWDDKMRIAGGDRTAYAETPGYQVLRHGSLVDVWTQVINRDYWPVTVTVEYFMFQVFGSSSTMPYHLLKLILHISNSLLIWKLLTKLGIHRYGWIAAILVAIHPLSVSSVIWISQLKTVLATFFLLCSALSWLKYDEDGSAKSYWSTVLLFLASTLSKTSSIMFPFVILLYEWYKNGKIGYREIYYSIPFFLISLAIGTTTISFQGTSPGSFEYSTVRPLDIFIHYFISSFYPKPIFFTYPQFSLWFYSLFIPIFHVSYRLSYLKEIILGFGFFCIMLFPVMGIVSIPASFTLTVVNDHYMYLPMLGLIGIITALVAEGYVRLGLDRLRNSRYKEILVKCCTATVIIYLSIVSFNHAKLYKT